MSAFLRGVQIRAFDMCAQQRGGLWDVSGCERGEDLRDVSLSCPSRGIRQLVMTAWTCAGAT